MNLVVGGGLSISDNGLQISPHPTQKKAAVPPKGSFDKKTGRCKKHPSVILAKKSSFRKGWDIVHECPLCDKASNKSTNNGLGVEEGAFSKVSTKKMNALLQDRNDTENSLNRPLPSLKAPSPNDCRHSETFGNPEGDINCAAHVLCMPYTTPWGEPGWYTGEVNNSGKPHGQGRMRYKTGKQTGGEWMNGYSEEFLEHRGRIKSGFGLAARS